MSVVLTPPSLIATAVEEASFAGVIALIRTLYSPKLISAHELAAKLSHPDARSRPLLLDARRIDEFRQSHLAGAMSLHLLPPPFIVGKSAVERIRKVLAGKDKEQEIVCYCAAGLRSSRLSCMIRRLGYKNVRVLREGLYNWLNAGFPLYNSEGNRCSHIRAQHWLSTILIHDKTKILKAMKADQPHTCTDPSTCPETASPKSESESEGTGETGQELTVAINKEVIEPVKEKREASFFVSRRNGSLSPVPVKKGKTLAHASYSPPLEAS